MQIFATKEIECGGQKRLFKVNLYATAKFCEYKGIKLSQFESRFVDPSLLDIMELAYYACLQGGNKVEIDTFMEWFDDSNLILEFSELMNQAFKSADDKLGKQRGKPTKAR
jgi:hypothetical protein